MEKNINRRNFIKAAGAAALTTGAVALTGCAPKTHTKPAPAAAEDGPEGMAYRINPKNGDKVSLLGYGCMRWPMIKDAAGRDVIDQKVVDELVAYAMENGVNYYDTSPAYLRGQSERAAGIALSRYERESYFIATKLSNFGDASEKASLKMYEDSFEQMHTKYFDYYLLHSIGGGGWPVFQRRYLDNGMVDFLKKEKEKGRIRNLGFSFHGNQAAFDDFMAMHDRGDISWDFVQIQMNYIDWTHADGVRNVNAEYLYNELDKREIPIIIMEPLQGGRLASVPENIATQLKTREPDRSIASWAFRFVGSYPRILTILSGMTSMEPLLDNLQTFSRFKPLTEEEIAFMEEMAVLMKEYPMVNCNYCNYCMPCPFGLDIPGIFRHYNNAVTEGTFAKSREQQDYAKLRRAYLVSYDRAIPTLRQADHCVQCNECLPHCPQSTAIPDELLRIDRYVESLKRNTL